MRPPLSKYDYGYIRDGGPDWFGGGGLSQFYGPPLSFWWSIWALAFLKTLLWTSVLFAMTQIGGG